MKNSAIKTGMLILVMAVSLAVFSGCCKVSDESSESVSALNVRAVVDTIGFAHRASQMDSIAARLQRVYGDTVFSCLTGAPWKTSISPHDDYTYAGKYYADALKCVKAPLLFMFGVAHKARKFDLQNKIVFGSYDEWRGPYGNVKISPFRDELISLLPDSLYIVHNDMMKIEHSLEALIPFLQYQNRSIEIVPILVPYMPYDRMAEIAAPLAKAIRKITEKHHLKWGKDFALVISTDAVHYGDEDWGGKNFARFGVDPQGNAKAVAYEHEIIDNCLTGELTPDKVKRFTEYTVAKEDYRQYKWTWCGRYSVPLGLLTSYELGKITNTHINGYFLGYGNSIDHPRLEVEDLGMGITAPATQRHWVGYAAIGYR